MLITGDISTASVALLLAFSFAMGLKHAVEPDHLAAVSTIVAERGTIWSSSLVGGLWGVGHTLALMIVGIAVIAFEFEIGERLTTFLELGVGLMLVVLGADTLRKVVKGGTVHSHVHRHGPLIHAHPHVHDPQQVHAHAEATRAHHGLRPSARPVFVGIVHGFAGSGALMLLILATIPSSAVAFGYILVFGLGSIGGMILMSTILGVSFHFTAERIALFDKAWRPCTAIFSVSFGVIWLATLLPRFFG